MCEWIFDNECVYFFIKTEQSERRFLWLRRTWYCFSQNSWFFRIIAFVRRCWHIGRGCFVIIWVLLSREIFTFLVCFIIFQSDPFRSKFSLFFFFCGSSEHHCVSADVNMFRTNSMHFPLVCLVAAASSPQHTKHTHTQSKLPMFRAVIVRVHLNTNGTQRRHLRSCCTLLPCRSIKMQRSINDFSSIHFRLVMKKRFYNFIIESISFILFLPLIRNEMRVRFFFQWWDLIRSF